MNIFRQSAKPYIEDTRDPEERLSLLERCTKLYRDKVAETSPKARRDLAARLEAEAKAGVNVLKGVRLDKDTKRWLKDEGFILYSYAEYTDISWDP